MLAIGLVTAAILEATIVYARYANYDAPASTKLGSMVLFVMEAIAAGLGFAILLDYVFKKRVDQFQPGHWRLMVYGIGLIGALVMLPWSDLDEYGLTEFVWQPERFRTNYARDILGVILFGWILLTTREVGTWKMYAWLSLASFAASVLIALVGLFSSSNQDIWTMTALILMLASFAIPVISLIAMFVGIVLDKQNGVRRDRYHWLGILFPFIDFPLLLVVQFAKDMYLLQSYSN